MEGISGAFGGNTFANGMPEAGPSRGNKRKAGDLDDWMDGAMAARSAPRLVESQQLRAPRASSSGESGSGRRFALPPVRASLALALGNVSFEAKNEATQARVTFSRGGREVWDDEVDSAVLTIATTEYFSAVACEDGSLHIYGPGGRL